jgi:Xaa-Pro dipeptidase
MLTVEHSRQRQRRLLDVMQRRRLDAAVVGAPHHCWYFTAQRHFWLNQTGFVLFNDGRSWMAAAQQEPKEAAADETAVFEAKWMSTVRQEQPSVVAELVLEALRKRGAKRIGVDSSMVSAQVVRMLGEQQWGRANGPVESIDDELFQLRRRKDPDELELMKKAVACSKAMHARARQIIEPGVEELHVFGELHAAAVKEAGEPLSDRLGNDYACGAGGGPPRRDRRAEAGELYILDLGPAYRGYFADNCRTYSVVRQPTDVQLNVWQNVKDAFPIVERMARPGVRCREIFEAVDEHFRQVRGKGMPHHLGHGVGLQPHEYPHLNPKWDDVLLEGEVFSAEPGQYGEDLRAGIRLENSYVVTSTGVENLLADVPLELA